MCPEIQAFKLVNGPKLGGAKEKVVKAAAGITFSVVLTESGKGEWALTFPGGAVPSVAVCSVRIRKRGEGPAWERAGRRAHCVRRKVCLRF